MPNAYENGPPTRAPISLSRVSRQILCIIPTLTMTRIAYASAADVARNSPPCRMGVSSLQPAACSLQPAICSSLHGPPPHAANRGKLKARGTTVYTSRFVRVIVMEMLRLPGDFNTLTMSSSNLAERPRTGPRPSGKPSRVTHDNVRANIGPKLLQREQERGERTPCRSRVNLHLV